MYVIVHTDRAISIAPNTPGFCTRNAHVAIVHAPPENAGFVIVAQDFARPRGCEFAVDRAGSSSASAGFCVTTPQFVHGCGRRVQTRAETEPQHLALSRPTNGRQGR
jgi:hypothetical protein